MVESIPASSKMATVHYAKTAKPTMQRRPSPLCEYKTAMASYASNKTATAMSSKTATAIALRQ